MSKCPSLPDRWSRGLGCRWLVRQVDLVGSRLGVLVELRALRHATAMQHSLSH